MSSTTRKRKSSQKIIALDTDTSDDEFDKLVRAKKRKETKDNNIDNSLKLPATAKRTSSRKVATKSIAKKSKKSADTSDGSSSEDDVKLISIPENTVISERKPPRAVAATSTSHSKTGNYSKQISSSTSWTDEQLLSEIQNIDHRTSANIIKLLNNDNTIPFICRYRKELIGDLTPDQ